MVDSKENYKLGLGVEGSKGYIYAVVNDAN